MTEPDCRFGYPITQLRAMLGDRFGAFADWSRGQTGVQCCGTDCGPHGLVVYRTDVWRFLREDGD